MKNTFSSTEALIVFVLTGFPTALGLYGIYAYSYRVETLKWLTAISISFSMVVFMFLSYRTTREQFLDQPVEEELIEIPAGVNNLFNRTIDRIPVESRGTFLNLLREKNLIGDLDKEWFRLVDELYRKDPDFPAKFIPADSNKLREIIHRLEELERDALRSKEEGLKPIREQIAESRELEDNAIMEGVDRYLGYNL